MLVQEEDPNSILDTDLYKLTMHYAVWSTYPNLKVSYRFFNRSKSTQPFSRSAYINLSNKIQRLKTRILTDDEKDWLKSNCDYLPIAYLDYLKNYRFKPEQHLRIRFESWEEKKVKDKQDNQDVTRGIEERLKNDQVTVEGVGNVKEEEEWGDLEIWIEGLWVDTILYEVPLLSMISESYFETVDRDWSYDSQVERVQKKVKRLIESNCQLSEFGTRRRRSWKIQYLIIDSIQQFIDNYFNPQDLNQDCKDNHNNQKTFNFTTSNVWMARRFNIKPIGTMAHEFIMAEAALNGYLGANIRVLKLWESCFPNHPELWIALTDTFGAKPFFEELGNDPDRAKRWLGLRQDSGDPKNFIADVKKLWNSLGINPSSKLIIFSDGLDVERCCELRKICQNEGLRESYGIGTHLTNDFCKLSQFEKSIQEEVKSKPLNIVIKLTSVEGIPCVKLSDVMEKAIGPKEEIAKIRSILHV